MRRVVGTVTECSRITDCAGSAAAFPPGCGADRCTGSNSCAASAGQPQVGRADAVGAARAIQA
eukprot:364163-Chlamydomonas_euryale.AAC.9